MPFSHPPLVAPARPRRPKDKDSPRESRNTPSSGGSSSGKRGKESASRNRTPPHSLRPAQPSLYTQQNLTLDQLPALPASGSDSPSNCSHILHANPSAFAQNPISTSAGAVPAFAAGHFHTPAALQPYLEPEDDEPSRNEASELREPSAQIEPLPVGPVATTRAIEPLQSLVSIPPRTLSPQSAETTLFRAPSPPPSVPSPFRNQPYPAPGTFDHTQSFSQNLSFVGSPPQFALAQPYLTGARDQYYAPPPYGGTNYLALAPPPGTFSNLQPAPNSVPYYAGFGSPPQTQPPYQVMHNSSTRGRSSLRSFSGESFPKDPPSYVRPLEQSALAGGSTVSNRTSEDDALDLLQRIQSAIPDIHLLVDRHKEASGQLRAREALVRETEAQKAAALKIKEAHIGKLIQEAENLASKHSAESSKFRLEIGNMEEKHKELHDHLQMERNVKEELKAQTRVLQEEKQQAERALKELRVSMDRESTVWKEVSHGYAVQQKALEAELKRVKQEHEARLQAQETKLRDSWVHERAGLQAEWLGQKRTLEESHTRLRREWEIALESRQKAVEESHRKQLQDRTSWDKERDTLTRNWHKEREALTHDWDEERAVLGKGSEEQRTFLRNQYQRDKEELQRKWQSSQTRANKQAEEVQGKLRKDIDRLKTGWDADKSKFSKATAELRNAVVRLNEDNVKLQKLAEAFGDVTDLKSREDPFYHEAFYHLHKQIVDLSAEHSQQTAGTIPSNVATRIPERMLSCLSNPDGSARLRAAYIEHIISSVITRRIFTPFLFTLSPRQRSTDQLFQSWSDHMRDKSTRKEALWRQRTLHAAYTVASAKQTINKVAGNIVNEIIDAIKGLALPTQLEKITEGVRRIVKTAAETWRYARLEIPLITASMMEEERPCALHSKTGHDATHADVTSPIFPRRQVLLPLFPIIEREAIHENMREDSKMNDQGCVYFPGRMLYVDDPEIINIEKTIPPAGAMVAGRDSADAPLNAAEEMASGTSLGDDRSAAHIEPTGSPFLRSPPEWQSSRVSSTSSARSVPKGVLHVKPAAKLDGQVMDEAGKQRSSPSPNLTPALSQSSVTSASYTGESSSTTRADLPDWTNKETGSLGPEPHTVL